MSLSSIPLTHRLLQELTLKVYENLSLKDLAKMGTLSRLDREKAEHVAKNAGFANLADIGETRKCFAARRYFDQIPVWKFKETIQEMKKGVPGKAGTVLPALFRALVVDSDVTPHCFKDDKRLKTLRAAVREDSEDSHSQVESELSDAETQEEEVVLTQNEQDLAEVFTLDDYIDYYPGLIQTINNDDRDVMTALLDREEGGCLVYASDRLRNDLEFVKMAVRLDGMDLEHASDNLKDDLSVVHLAMMQNSNALQYASQKVMDIINAIDF